MAAQDENSVSRREAVGNRKAKSFHGRQLKKRDAMKIVRRYMLLSGGIGLVAVPWLDQMILAGLLAKMIHDLCRLYGINMAEHKLESVITAVLGGAHSEWISRYLRRYSKRYLPGIRGIAGIVIRPAIAVAITYSVGMLFVHHFDKGVWVNSLPKPISTLSG